MASNKFKNHNEIFIAAVESVNYFDLLKYLKPTLCRSSLIYPKGTIFYLLAGIHHEPSTKDHGKPGRSDPSLLSQFYHTLLKYLQNICGFDGCKQCQKLITVKPCTTSVWKDMDYQLKVIQLETTVENEEESQSYVLSETSKKDLQELSKDLCNQTKKDAKPSALIFASCYSMFSNITNILRANGVITVMNMSKDKGDVSEGKAFHLDSQQQYIISKLSDAENNKNLIVTGPPGSGKTVIITEALKMKVAQCKQKDIPVKIILATFSRDACPQLCLDLKGKYNLDYLMKEFQANTKTMEELFEEYGLDQSWHTALSENINSLIKAVKKKIKQVDSKLKCIILLDEVEIWFDKSYDLSDIELFHQEIDLLIAINPTSQECLKEYDVKLPADSNSIIEQLRFRHRNCIEICVFFLHFMQYANTPENTLEKLMDGSANIALHDSTFSSGRNPHWILTAKHLPDENVLEVVDKALLPNDRNDVILINGIITSIRDGAIQREEKL